IPGLDAAQGEVFPVDYTIEGSDVGYRWFAREGKAPRYWFGHGLSYSQFGYSALSLSGGKTLSAQVTVTNNGKVAGKEVVQLYLTGTPAGPKRRLLGFSKLALAPGESRTVTVDVDPRLVADFDVKAHGWTIAKGRYEVGIGRDAGTMVLTGSAGLDAATLKP
ncbi:MAG: glycosyl hydrolase, partial [Proteobacteria bacterium]|nr:glycosyl hydrolase [Pseudomonadota bacterium]